MQTSSILSETLLSVLLIEVTLLYLHDNFDRLDLFILHLIMLVQHGCHPTAKIGTYKDVQLTRGKNAHLL